MLKAMKDEIKDVEEDEDKEQFDVDSKLKNHQNTKKKELDELTIVATAMLMLIAGCGYHRLDYIFSQFIMIVVFEIKVWVLFLCTIY